MYNLGRTRASAHVAPLAPPVPFNEDARIFALAAGLPLDMTALYVWAMYAEYSINRQIKDAELPDAAAFGLVIAGGAPILSLANLANPAYNALRVNTLNAALTTYRNGGANAAALLAANNAAALVARLSPNPDHADEGADIARSIWLRRFPLVMTVNGTDGERVPAAQNIAQTLTGDNDGPVVRADGEFSAENVGLIREMWRAGTIMKHMVELVACMQVSDLKESNISSYLKSARMHVSPARVRVYVSYFAAGLDKIASREGFAGIAAESDFCRYHTTAASTGSLVLRMLDALPLAFAGVASVAERAAVAEAVADPSDMMLQRAIPSRLLVHTRAFFAATKVDIPRWYMGAKAEEAYSPVLFKKLVEVYKRMVELSVNDAGIAAATDMTALFATVTGV